MRAENMLVALVAGYLTYVGLDGYSLDIKYFIFNNLSFIHNGFAMFIAKAVTSQIGIIYLSVCVTYSFSKNLR